MAEWARVVATTIKNYIKGEEVNILRNRKILALLMDKGQIEFNCSGTALNWRTRYRQHPIQGYSDQATLVFPRKNRWQEADLDWRGYATTDSITKKERLMNKGVPAIINVFSQQAELLMEDMEDQFGPELYIDGNAAGNELRIHGVESFMGSSGVSATQPVAVNSDTYAGLSTTLANYGGTWTGNWPDGKGDAHYDFWTPLLIDYTSAVAASSGGWSATTKTWPNTCSEAIAYGILYTQKNRGKKGLMDVWFLNQSLYRQYIEAQRGKERINVTNTTSKLLKLGFTDTINQDGVDITSEFDIPAGTGYGFNVDAMKLCSMQGQLFVPDGPEWSIDARAWRFALDFWGNARFNPRNFCKLYNYT